MLSRKTDNSSYLASMNYLVNRLLAILPGHFVQWTHRCRSCPHENVESVHIVGQIPQPHIRFHPHQTYHSHDQFTGPLGLYPKEMFYPTADSGTRAIPLLLSVRQLLMPTPLTLKMFPKSPFLQFVQLFLRTIRRVRPDVSTTFIFIQKSLKDLTVVDRGRRDLIGTNQFMFHVHVDVILVAVVVLAILLGPASIGILLPLLMLAPILRNVALLNSLVLFATISLPGNRNDTGIHNLAFAGRKPMFTKKHIKLPKRFFNQSCFSQLLPKQPDGLGVWDGVPQRQAQKPHKRQTVPNLKFRLLVGKIIQRLQNQNLKHQHDVKGFSTCSRRVRNSFQSTTF